MANRCRTCRFFSELIARGGNSGLEAMCLNDCSLWHGEYVAETWSCDDFAAGDDGAIDAPGRDPLRYDAEAHA